MKRTVAPATPTRTVTSSRGAQVGAGGAGVAPVGPSPIHPVVVAGGNILDESGFHNQCSDADDCHRYNLLKFSPGRIAKVVTQSETFVGVRRMSTMRTQE